jgi:diguanylate cyclase (GGDEF)-like protein
VGRDGYRGFRKVKHKGRSFTPDGFEDRTAVLNLDELQARRSSEPDRHLLVGIHGSQLGQIFRLSTEPTRIGRGEAELRLDDGGVSRQHARIIWEANQYVIEDLESANGTFVQGSRVNRRILQDGDVIQLGPSAVFRYSVTDKEQEEMLRELYAASITDSLTGARNRKYFDSHLGAELSYARRHKTDVSLVMLDIDGFKNVNDTYGHAAGDAVLVQIAGVVPKIVRNEDVFARYGGEEFAIVLRSITVLGAQHAAERLRQTVESMVVVSGANQIRVTVSAGCAAISECAQPEAQELIAKADRRLYAAKHLGRNRVVAAD